MSTKDAYKRKIEAELELVQAKLAKWKATAKNLSADMSIELHEETSEVEKLIESLKINMKELAVAGENSWEKLKATGEVALESIAKRANSISEKIKS